MKLLANENFPLASVKYLAVRNYDIKGIGIDNPSISDNDVMDIAINENRIILTFDRDYGELIFKRNYRPEMGVIYLRLESYESDEPGRILEKILADNTLELKRKLTVITKDSIRQRSY